MTNYPSKQSLILLSLFLCLFLFVSTVFAAPIPVGDHTIEYQGRSPEVPTASSMTFYYTITSGGGQGVAAISHIDFNLAFVADGECLTADTTASGSWIGTGPIDPLNPPTCTEDYDPSVGPDPTVPAVSGQTVLKFNDAFQEGEIRNVCLTVSASPSPPNFVGPGTIDFYTKAGGGGNVMIDHAEVTGPVCTDTVTAVELDWFKAEAQADGTVLVSWQTAAEWDHAGFNVYRSSSADSTLNLVNETIVAATGVQGQGSIYDLNDTSVAPGTWWYTLEDIDIYGVRTLHEPVAVTINSPTAISLLTSSSNAGLASPLLLLTIAVLLVSLAIALHRQKRFERS